VENIGYVMEWGSSVDPAVVGIVGDGDLENMIYKGDYNEW
jgi:hypothetical protein